MRRPHGHLAATARPPPPLPFSPPSSREGLMKHSSPLPQSSGPSVPALYMCLSGPTLHIHFSSIASYSSASTLKSLLPLQFAAPTAALRSCTPSHGED